MRLHDSLKATFPGDDKPLLRATTQGVRLLSEEIWTAAKLGPGSRLHESRHRWVSRLLDAGVFPAAVKDRAGHADLVTTMGYHHGIAAATAVAVAALAGEKRDTNATRSKLSR